MTEHLIDKWGRSIDYLRVSVTDRCNMRCVYCMPSQGVESLGCQDILRYEEIVGIVAIAKELGISHVRITGGEPLVRKGVVDLVREIKTVGIQDISMTTNAALLPKYAVALKEAGLSRVNISLDSLKPEMFSKITRNGELSAVMAGIGSAIEAGLHPVKINVVVMEGVNADELGDMAALTKKMPVHVRFIEVMPVGPDHQENEASFVPVSLMKQEIEKEGPLNAVKSPKGAGPAETFALPDALGTVGFIAALSHPFCASCNRLRLTADGKLKPCLAADYEVDVKKILRSANHEDKPSLLKAAFRDALDHKPSGHEFWAHKENSRRMCQIGG